MEIKPIKTERDYRAALNVIDRLWSARRGSPQADRLDVLATLVEAYEDKHFPILPPDPIEAIKFRMEQQGLNTSDLARVVGGRNRASEILSRKRGLSLAMIRNLHRKFHIPAESLIAA
jgi:HTH-type transcriptional regulator/antitoxin HigA